MRFSVLRIIADQFYYNVHDVRTKDDTLLNVKLMIFFEIKVCHIITTNIQGYILTHRKNSRHWHSTC